MWRQGDLLITSATLDERERGMTTRIVTDNVLARGEATGHAHRVVGDGVQVFELRGQMYVEVPDTATIEHEEHGPIALAAGLYRVTRQRQFAGENSWETVGD